MVGARRGMRILFVSVVLAATSAVVSAEPSLVASAPPEPTSYLGGGVAGGVAYNGRASGVAYGAFEVEGGIRLGDPRLWAHVVLAQGAMADVDGGGSSPNDYFDARVGLESPVCSAQPQSDQSRGGPAPRSRHRHRAFSRASDRGGRVR